MAGVVGQPRSDTAVFEFVQILTLVPQTSTRKGSELCHMPLCVLVYIAHKALSPMRTPLQASCIAGVSLLIMMHTSIAQTATQMSSSCCLVVSVGFSMYK